LVGVLWGRLLAERVAARFVVVGSVGFAIDGGVLTTLVNGVGFGPYSARLASFTVAVSATWALNRAWTFADATDRSAVRQYGLYFVLQTVGASINLAVYALGVEMVPLMARFPVAPLAMASVVAMAFNYVAARRLVFVRAVDRGGTVRVPRRGRQDSA
jgi:putative flippase GtrA